jgi:PilZ domain
MSNIRNITRKLKAVATGQDLERRRFKRREIEKHLGSFLVDSKGVEHAVNVLDISENGISMDVTPPDAIKVAEGDSVGIRLYLTQTNYIHLRVSVRTSEFFREENCQRVGATFSSGGKSDVTMYHLVRFIEIMAHIIDANEKALKAA